MTIKKRNLLNVLLIFFLLKPVGLDNYSVTLNTIMNIFRLCSIFIINILFLATIKKRKLNLSIKFIGIIEIFVLISCLINKSGVYNALVFWHGIMSLLLLAEINKNNLRSFCKCIMITLIIYILINFAGIVYLRSIDIVVNQKTKFILGSKNMPILYIFPCLIILFLLSDKKYNDRKKVILEKFLSFVFYLICFVSVLYTKSATSIVVIVLLVLYGIFLNSKIINRVINKINAKVLFYIMIIFFVLIVLVGIQKYFSAFIVDILGRDLTFTGRTIIWKKAIEMTKLRLIGWGWDCNLTNMYNDFFWQKYFDASNAHNFILNLAYKSGIITSIIYVIYLLVCSKKLNQNKTRNGDILKVAFLLFLLMTTFESYMNNFICMMFLTYLFVNNEELGEEK
ncbi:MAG: O-antigen ligase family protein [Bacilli bacterium]